MLKHRSGFPTKGLLVQPSDLSVEEVGAIMREARAKMIEEHGAETIEQADRNVREHIAKVSRSAVQILI